MTYVTYKPFCAATIGNTVSCKTLERILNEIADMKLSRKITSHINKYFAEVKSVSLAIHCSNTRKYVGYLLLTKLSLVPIEFKLCDEILHHVIRNIKIAYVKDMLISEVPINYQRKYTAQNVDWLRF
jgi:hypothetical protein